MLEISVLTLACALGCGFAVGSIAGLLPGVHVNNTSAILLGFSPALTAAGVEPLYVAIIIVASTIAQSFLDVIPTVFIGAPDEGTALAVMPGHRLLLEGRGSEAVRLSALGSGLALVLSLLLIIPLSVAFKAALSLMQANMAIILICISAFVILSNYSGGRYSTREEKLRKTWWALLIFLVAGGLGVAAMKAEGFLAPPVALGTASVLLPLLSGLFGVPALLTSLKTGAGMPAQRESGPRLPPGDIARAAAAGTLAGALVSWFPAVSSGVATSLVGALSKRDGNSDRRYLVSVSGVNTAGAIFSLVALYVILRPRSGAVAAAQEVLGGSISRETFTLFLLCICIVGAASYLATIKTGSYAARAFARVNYRTLGITVLAFLGGMCALLAGIAGLSIMLISATVGLAAHLAGTRKTCLMGVLLVPCIMYFL